MMQRFHCDVYGLEFELKNNRLAIIVDGKKSWVDVPKASQKRLNETVEAYFHNKEEEAKMSPQQLAEKYAEYMGS